MCDNIKAKIRSTNLSRQGSVRPTNNSSRSHQIPSMKLAHTWLFRQKKLGKIKKNWQIAWKNEKRWNLLYSCHLPTPAGKWGLRSSNTVYYKYLTVEENLVKITLTLRVSSESEASWTINGHSLARYGLAFRAHISWPGSARKISVTVLNSQ